VSRARCRSASGGTHALRRARARVLRRERAHPLGSSSRRGCGAAEAARGGGVSERSAATCAWLVPKARQASPAVVAHRLRARAVRGSAGGAAAGGGASGRSSGGAARQPPRRHWRDPRAATTQRLCATRGGRTSASYVVSHGCSAIVAAPGVPGWIVSGGPSASDEWLHYARCRAACAPVGAPCRVVENAASAAGMRHASASSAPAAQAKRAMPACRAPPAPSGALRRNKRAVAAPAARLPTPGAC
jgi:hypothetical protein